tara:strand:- start:65 stop:316 length:252 start_codon:yes stop_codon:yes gene_type:complete
MFLQGSTPNSDWGAARGAGKTNNPSLYNVKYRASQIKRSNGRTVFINTRKPKAQTPAAKANGGAYRDRTDDLLNANQALSQLS